MATAMEWYEAEVRALEQATLQSLPAEPAVFYGSSSITLWSTLARDLASNRAVNLGFGGSTLEACVWFFERLVPPTRPASLVVYAGDNDLGDGQTPRQVRRRFEALSAVERNLGGTVDSSPSSSRACSSCRRSTSPFAVGEADSFCESTDTERSALGEERSNRLDVWPGGSASRQGLAPDGADLSLTIRRRRRMATIVRCPQSRSKSRTGLVTGSSRAWRSASSKRFDSASPRVFSASTDC